MLVVMYGGVVLILAMKSFAMAIYMIVALKKYGKVKEGINLCAG
jgi:hypothetical protein